jgi:co-chaperonin GroES (HSP10)
MLEPLNRHVLLEPIESEEAEEKSTILVPDDYSVPTSRHGLCKVLAVARDCDKFNDTDVNKTVLVNNSMIEEIKVEETVYYLMLENHAYGLFNEG